MIESILLVPVIRVFSVCTFFYVMWFTLFSHQVCTSFHLVVKRSYRHLHCCSSYLMCMHKKTTLNFYYVNLFVTLSKSLAAFPLRGGRFYKYHLKRLSIGSLYAINALIILINLCKCLLAHDV